MAKLNYEAAHKVVDANYNLYWDGWDIKSWRRDHKGFFNKQGIFKNGNWGIVECFAMEDDGTWKVPDKYVKYIK